MCLLKFLRFLIFIIFLIKRFPNFLKVIKNSKSSFLLHLITQLTFISMVKISQSHLFLKDGSYLKGLNQSQKSPQKKTKIIQALKHDFNGQILHNPAISSAFRMYLFWH